MHYKTLIKLAMNTAIMKWCLHILQLGSCHPGSHPLLQRPSIGSHTDLPKQCPQDSAQLYPYVPDEHCTEKINDKNAKSY